MFSPTMLGDEIHWAPRRCDLLQRRSRLWFSFLLLQVNENGSEAPAQTLKAPSPPRKDSISEISDILDNLKLDISEQDLKNLQQLTETSVQDDKDIKKLANMVYEKCVSDREFAKTGAFICDKLASIENTGTKFRSTLLSLVQVDFKSKLGVDRQLGNSLQKHAYSNILNISPPKNENFQIKNSDRFYISAENIVCGYSLELPQWGGSNEYPQSMFLSRNKKHYVYPCKPQFYYIKWGLKGSKLYRYVFVMWAYMYLQIRMEYPKNIFFVSSWKHMLWVPGL